MKKFWNWVHDDSGGRTLRLEGPIDSENFWGDEITPQDFRSELEAGDGDVTVWINSPGGNSTRAPSPSASRPSRHPPRPWSLWRATGWRCPPRRSS